MRYLRLASCEAGSGEVERDAAPRVAARPWRVRALGLALGVLATGCYSGLQGPVGADGDSGGSDSSGDDDGTADDTGGSDDTGAPELEPQMSYSCDDEQQKLRGTTFAEVRRLSSVELANTLRDLLGDALVGDPEIAARLSGLPEDVTVIAGDFVDDPPLGLALAMSGLSQRAVELALADPAWVSQRLPPCVAADTIDDACATAVASEFGARVWRRDLADAEVSELVGFHQDMGAGADGLRYMLRRILQAPSLVFHLEHGAGEAVDGRVRLTDFEVASRISYLTANTMPDDALLAAARAGELRTREAVESHVRRLLTSDRAVLKITDFFRYYSKLTSVADPLPAIAELLDIHDTAGLGLEMQQEAFDFFAHVVWSDGGGDFADLMGSTAAFPRSAALARVFGVEPVAGDEPASAASHPGLLHRPGLLSSHGSRTSPILRGAHVRKLFLCDELGLPDPAAVEEREDEVGDIEDMSNRDRVTALTDAPACAGCHGLINHLGFTFERYDQLGAPRLVESIVDVAGAVVKTWPLDTRVDDLKLEPGGTSSVDDSVELASAMVESYKARACFSRRVFEYYRLQTAHTRGDGCVLHEEEVQSHDGALLDVFVAAVANEDIFYKKAP